ncbi:FMRFamide receptor-like [Haliotis rufescens]|uniref:FMRFamide receptor-like n=1 Tax=Haliotis rufescens TaxID=6454 RepID=UPI001EB06370|nr:FMRFamide receptor-like [Haliotis rufescens]
MSLDHNSTMTVDGQQSIYVVSSHENNTDPLFVISTLTSLLNGSDVEGATASTVSDSLKITRFVVQKVLVPLIVTVGLLGNILNIAVLSHPSMRNSTNIYLMALGFADTIYLIFMFTLSFIHCSDQNQPRWSLQFIPYGRVITDIAGNFAVWITVIFTIERYVAVCLPMKGKVWCTVGRARLYSFLAMLFCAVNTLPEMFELEIVPKDSGGWKCRYTAMTKEKSYQIGFNWWYVTIFTLVPFVFLIIFNTLLIRSLLRAKKKRQLMVQSSVNKMNVKSTREENKVTLMLVTIVIIFLLCQLPWTVLLLYRSYLDDHGIKVPVNDVKIAGNICNFLVQINASINFYLYSFFSRKFRKTFKAIFCFKRVYFTEMTINPPSGSLVETAWPGMWIYHLVRNTCPALTTAYTRLSVLCHFLCIKKVQ